MSAINILQWLWESTAVASLLAIVAALVSPLLYATPRWQYRLWLLVALRLLLPITPESPISLLGIFTEEIQPVADLSQPVADVSPGPVSFDSVAIATPNRTALTLPDVLLGFWLGGVVFCFGRVWRAHSRFRKALAQSRSASPELRALLSRAAGTVLARNPAKLRVLENEIVPAPALFGFLKPVLLLPPHTLKNFSDTEVHAMFIHELIHLKRRDVLLNWLLIAAQSVHWFNPIIWWAFARLKRARELACDAATLSVLPPSAHTAYGAALLKAASSMPMNSPALVSAATSKTKIKERITMITNYAPGSMRPKFWPALVIVALALVTFTRAQEESPPPKKDASTTPPAAPRSEKTDLRKELSKQQQLLLQKREELYDLQRNFRLSDVDLIGSTGGELSPESLQRLNALRLEAKADYEKIASLYTQLTNASGSQLRRSIATAVPDELYSQLSSTGILTEQKLAEALDSYGESHPEVKKLRRVQLHIEKQISERLEGILAGLKVKMEAERNRLKSLEKDLEISKTRQIELSAVSRPLRDLQREISQMEEHIDDLRKRLLHSAQ